MKNIEKIAEELFDKIRSRFEKITIGDEEADETDEPGEARFFNFDYVDNEGHNYGNIMINIVDEESLKVYFSKDITSELNEVQQKEWYNFLKDLRYFAKRNLLTFDTRDISKSNLTIRDVKQIAKDSSVSDATTVNESKLYGTTRTSIQEFGPVRLLIRHSDAVNEEIPGARSRRIQAMFIETDLGERFRMPFTKLSAGRAMAQHLAHGGQVHDDAGQHIVEMVNEMNSLAFFARNTRNRMFEDSETQAMADAAIQRYQELRSTLKHMGGARGYQAFAESFEPTLPVEEEFDMESLKDRFVKKMFDDRLTQALPYVQRAYQHSQNESQDQYVREFGNWANEVVNEQDGNINQDDLDKLVELMDTPLTVGVDGIDAINALKDIISDDDLFTEITDLSRDSGTEADARPVINQWVMDQGYDSIYEPEPTVPAKEPPVQDTEPPAPTDQEDPEAQETPPPVKPAAPQMPAPTQQQPQQQPQRPEQEPANVVESGLAMMKRLAGLA